MKKTSRRGPYRRLLGAYLAPQGRRVTLLGLLLLVTIGLELANPQILRAFIDTARAAGSLDSLVTIGLLFLGVAVATQVVSVAETYVAENIGLTATNRLRADLTLHCLELDPSFHSSHTPGELIERIDGDVATLGNFFSRFVVHLAGNALLLLGILTLLFVVDVRVGATMTGFALLTLTAIFIVRNVGVPHWTAARQASADLFGFLEEHLSATEDLRANGATGYVLRRLHERSRILLQRQRKAGLFGATSWTTTLFLLAVSTALALALGAALFTEGTITLGTVYLIFSYTQMLVRPVEQIARQFQDLQQATASMGRINTLLDRQPSIRDGHGAPLAAGALGVAFEDVTFGYEANEPVLHDLSFTVPPGAVLGVLGRTGSGKTTLTRLLFRLYDPADGAIALGGADLRTLRLGDLRRSVGLVTQDIQLFHASVRDNLTFFDRTIPDARIVAVLDELGLGPWYATLPQGLDTRLAPGGGGLSAGEAQLVAFARVFLRDPGVVILDEASSRLDPATEQQMERAVDRLLQGRTAIIIAHRLGTVGRADAILILDEGQCAEYGAREHLAHDPASRFAALLRTGLEEVLA